jgi:magnesium chelatase family protein
MLARVYSCAVIGLEEVVVEVEVDTAQGLPDTDIVGLPDKAVQESRQRVQAAVKNTGLPYPRKRIVVNLARLRFAKKARLTTCRSPSLGVLLLQRILPVDCVQDALVVGELSLDGIVRHTRGILPMAVTARAQGLKRIYVPEADTAEAALIPNLEVIPVPSLAALYDHLAGNRRIDPHPLLEVESVSPSALTDFREIKGQEHVKRTGSSCCGRSQRLDGRSARRRQDPAGAPCQASCRRCRTMRRWM